MAVDVAHAPLAFAPAPLPARQLAPYASLQLVVHMAKWIAQLALPDEVMRWEWKRFRLHYVLVPAQLIKRARQMWVRLMGRARATVDPLLIAFESL